MRIATRKPPILVHRPFQGQGVSAYAGASLPLVYRRMKSLRGKPFCRGGANYPIGSTNIAKSNRLGSDSGTASDDVSVDLDLSSYAPGTVYVDLRHYRDDLEWDGEHAQKIVLDDDGNIVSGFHSVAIFMGWVARVGGIVRFSFQYVGSDSGLQPATFELVRTAGPTSPDAVSVTASGSRVYTIDSEALADSAVYTFTIDAVDESSNRQTLLTITNVQADASGPPAVSLETEVV